MPSSSLNAHVIVLHVAKGYEDRRRHIESLSRRFGFEFRFMLDGDRDTLTSEILDRYFTGEMHVADNRTSCAYKHLLAYRMIIEENLAGALILEDDVLLYRKFPEIFNRSLAELKNRGIDDALISYEDTRLRFVPRSRRRKGQLLYQAEKDRFAACYYVSQKAARLLLERACAEKMGLPVDLFHCDCIRRAGLNYLWCQPAVASQGSFSGKFHSSLSHRYPAVLTPFVWRFKLTYKRMLYFLR